MMIYLFVFCFAKGSRRGLARRVSISSSPFYLFIYLLFDSQHAITGGQSNRELLFAFRPIHQSLLLVFSPFLY